MLLVSVCINMKMTCSRNYSIDRSVKVTNVHDHDTRIATINQRYIPIYGTVRGQKSCKHIGVRAWNYILQNIHTRCPIGSFKSSLRKLCMVCPINDIEFLN